MSEGITMVIGCDLGDKKSRICVLEEGEAVPVEETQIPTTKVGVRKYFQRFESKCLVVIETGTHSRWVRQELKELGHEVVVANPRKTRAIWQTDSKSDRSDAEMLARLGRADRTLLSPVELRSAAHHADLTWLKSRDLLVRQRVDLVNYVRSVLKTQGLRMEKCSTEAFAERAKEMVPQELRLEPVLLTLEMLSKQIKALDAGIAEMAGTRYPKTAVLQQVPGVGPVTAVAFVLTLGDPTRFEKSRTVGAYLGLRPRQDQSGSVDKHLGITKSGDPLLRRLLVNCAHYILGPLAPESDLRTWGLRLATRGGAPGPAKKRAVVAVARKLAVLLHRLWVTGEEYQAVGYGQPRVAEE